MPHKSAIKRILITGPESSGKTTLARSLAEAQDEPWVPEYAREYLEKYGPDYTLNDLIQIAEGQFRMEDQLALQAREFLFCDTGPLVLKIWAEYRFGICPEYIEKAWQERPYHQIILCKPTLPWVPDPLRENPDDRDVLFELYVASLEAAGRAYQISSK